MQETLAQSFVRYVHEDLLQIKQPHFDIAFRLAEAKRLGYAEELGFANIYELSEKEFGFKRSSTAAYISVCENYMDGMELKECYKGFSYSQLCEMLALPSYDRLQIKSTMTVRDIREYKKNHKFVTLQDGRCLLYGSLSPKEKQEYDSWIAENKKVEPVEESVQTSGRFETETDVDLQDFGKNMVAEPVSLGKSGRLNLKDYESRNVFLDNYHDWGVWISVPELNLTCYKYKFANGHELIISESYWYVGDNHLSESKRALLIRYHLIDDERTFFDLSGLPKQDIFLYMAKNSKNI